MATALRDEALPKEAPTSLLLEKHANFIVGYSQNKNDYEYIISEFLRINGVYWALTAVDFMGNRDKLEEEEVGSENITFYKAEG
jgi:geranylgeranyl transferase type-2 subunit beta